MQLGKAGGDQPPPFLRLNACSVPFQTAQPEAFNKGMERKFYGEEKHSFFLPGHSLEGKIYVARWGL